MIEKPLDGRQRWVEQKNVMPFSLANQIFFLLPSSTKTSGSSKTSVSSIPFFKAYTSPTSLIYLFAFFRYSKVSLPSMKNEFGANKLENVLG